MKTPRPNARLQTLINLRNLKMARSAHAFVRGNTAQFYEWLNSQSGRRLPSGPPVWICGDCHAGNLGPTGDLKGRIDIHIRDLDQSVIGNPAHDLVRLGLSLATAARGSDLPGVTTARMLEEMMQGYEQAFMNTGDEEPDRPAHVKAGMRSAVQRTWKHLAEERFEDMRPTIPQGKHFWALSRAERDAIKTLCSTPDIHALVTSLKGRSPDDHVQLLDSAYWVKGCSSLGLLRYAVLMSVGDDDDQELCLLDIKEAVAAAAPRTARARMPRDNGKRVVEGARHLSPGLGSRMVAVRMLDHSFFIRELLPQDMKLELDELTQPEAMQAAAYLAKVVGIAHARQMDLATRTAWIRDLQTNRSQTLDAPSWLWSSVVQLVGSHEQGYLEHCRRYAL
ncbi:DUF2252 domain-containing protein [Pseudomonas syringae]|uniref:DUF2252 domain-containing protein n=2 Tax=Pseudomonas syringae group TaxID=136849 RepID=A0A9Q4FHF0_PSESX|nr:DUF2252 domain-containing protein [Pseudomonas syringae]KTB59763.1 hypothetical protein AO067_13180 [Pseudomonas viridiflava ICMP 13104]KTB81811.1 hypothetical protein AO070_02770 [Pseudomonas syringae pv. syringae PD2766]MCF5466462.1 DUF2252 domain-containing protein [Pseudomonas syringae]MCF5471445.1 DUF2252 domain-containing protein [Pseudomonas syringae]MCF5482260.1 DUF2252 domain-containing protein [Pseudomonas syringae]